MVSLDDAVIARLKTHGQTFEIYVDPNKALEYKEGDDISIDDVLAVATVFKDARAGEKASEERMRELFGAPDVKVVADRIIKRGELHLTTEQRRQMLADTRKQIVNIIARNAINPQTGLPHPPARIEKAMEDVKVGISISKSAKEQVDGVLKALKPVLPIRFEKIEVAVRIPAMYSGKLYKILHEFGDVKKDEWVGGEQYCLIEIPAGLQDEFYSKMNNITHGDVKIKIIK